MEHILSTYKDTLKQIRYCVICGTEEDQPEFHQPCKGKEVPVDKKIDKKD